LSIGTIDVSMGGYIFGIQEPKPLRNFPEGRIRLRLRNMDFAKAFVKTADGIREYIIGEHNGYWVPLHLVGENAGGQHER
jgi:hypothetical protein